MTLTTDSGIQRKEADLKLEPASPYTAWLGVFIVLGVAVALWIKKEPLVSQRPQLDPHQKGLYSSINEVPSKLWEDPFDVIRRLAQYVGTNNLNEVSDDPLQWARGSSAEKSKLVIVCLPGGYYAADRENRLRARRAVILGLMGQQYVPRFKNNLRTTRLPDLNVGTHASMMRQWVTYETFEWTAEDRTANQHSPNSSRPSLPNITVVWLNESVISSEPLKSLNTLVGHWTKNGSFEDKVLIGPRTSDILKKMVEECSSVGIPLIHINPMTIYSTSATAADKYIDTKAHANSNNGMEGTTIRYGVEQSFGKLNIKFINCIHPDDVIMQAVVKELALRIDIHNQNKKILLLSEMDTLYGRSLPREFSNALNALRMPNKSGVSVEVRYYLHGVDGERPTLIGSNTTAALSRQSLLNVNIERAEGEKQLDYISSFHKPAYNESNGRSEDKNGYVAIGILGNDFHDKMVILQALKREYPKAVFFTTDLDGRMMHSENLRWTRNLIVGSSGDLYHPAKARTVQSFGGNGVGTQEHPTPGPFRDVHQTAINQSIVSIASSDGAVPLVPPAQVFEIGRTRPIRMPSDEDKPKSIWSLIPDIFRKCYQGWGLPALLGCMLASYLMRNKIVKVLDPAVDGLEKAQSIALGVWGKWKPHGAQSKANKSKSVSDISITRGSMIAFLLFNICACFVYIVAMIRSHCMGGEFFFWAEGTSVWPGGLISWLCSFTGICFLFYAREALIKNKRECAITFDLPERVKSWDEVKTICDENQSGNQNRESSKQEWLPMILLEILHRFRIAFMVSLLACDREDNKQDNGTAKVTQKHEEADLEHDQVNQTYNKLNQKYKELWKCYNALGFSDCRAMRIMISVVMTSGIGVLLLGMKPHIPFRGTSLLGVHHVPFLLACLVHSTVSFFVLDAALLCRQMIERIGKEIDRMHVSEGSLLDRYDVSDSRGVPPALRCNAVSAFMQVIGLRTEVLIGFGYFPFVTLILLLLSRSQIFDNWGWSIEIVLLYVGLAVVAVFSLLVLRGAVEKVRETCIRHIRKEQVSCEDPEQCSRLAQLREFVDDYEVGAFEPLSKQPVIKALAIPLAGIGIVGIMEMVAYL